ncbi:MAG: hypothetical protein Q4B99_06050 [Clostridia bacterium]|nr:hypothetical protein [Clostridia bacterium]
MKAKAIVIMCASITALLVMMGCSVASDTYFVDDPTEPPPLTSFLMEDLYIEVGMALVEDMLTEEQRLEGAVEICFFSEYSEQNDATGRINTTLRWCAQTADALFDIDKRYVKIPVSILERVYAEAFSCEPDYDSYTDGTDGVIRMDEAFYVELVPNCFPMRIEECLGQDLYGNQYYGYNVSYSGDAAAAEGVLYAVFESQNGVRTLTSVVDMGAIEMAREYVDLSGGELTFPDEQELLERVIPIRLTADRVYAYEPEYYAAFALSCYASYLAEDMGVNPDLDYYYLRLDVAEALRLAEIVLGDNSAMLDMTESWWTVTAAPHEQCYNMISPMPLIRRTGDYILLSPHCPTYERVKLDAADGGFAYSLDMSHAPDDGDIGYIESGMVTADCSVNTRGDTVVGALDVYDVSLHDFTHYDASHCTLTAAADDDALRLALCSARIAALSYEEDADMLAHSLVRLVQLYAADPAFEYAGERFIAIPDELGREYAALLWGDDVCELYDSMRIALDNTFYRDGGVLYLHYYRSDDAQGIDVTPSEADDAYHYIHEQNGGWWSGMVFIRFERSDSAALPWRICEFEVISRNWNKPGR